MSLYDYRLLKQDGTIVNLGVSNKKSLKELYKILNCHTVEVIPEEYYEGKGYGKCTMWGDEEARFLSSSIRNPHFNVLLGNMHQDEPDEWDVVGDILMEELVK